MLVNGRHQTETGVDSRGLAYGDGLFETIRLHDHRPVLLDLHMQRLARGCEVLGIADCEQALMDDLDTLRPSLPAEGVLKIILTRCSGGRGYRGALGQPPERIITLHPLPPDRGASGGISCFISRVRLARQPLLAGLKHLNRLEQVLASIHWPDEHCHEGLMLDIAGKLVEGTRSNLFLSLDGRLVTPALTDAGVRGVLRESLMASWSDIQCRELTISDLQAAEECFFGNSVAGIWPVTRLPAALSDGLLTQDLNWSAGPLSQQAARHFHEILTST